MNVSSGTSHTLKKTSSCIFPIWHFVAVDILWWVKMSASGTLEITSTVWPVTGYLWKPNWWKAICGGVQEMTQEVGCQGFYWCTYWNSKPRLLQGKQEETNWMVEKQQLAKRDIKTSGSGQHWTGSHWGRALK